MNLENVITFAEASEIWNLSKGTLNKAVGKKLIENVDCKKSSSIWLVTREAMIREYGIPESCFKLNKDEMFMNRDDFGQGNGYVRVYDALESSKGKEILMPWLTENDELESFTLLDFKMFNDIASYTIILKLKNKYSECIRLIPNIVFFRESEYEKDNTKKYWSFDCLNENMLAYIQKYAKDRRSGNVYYISEDKIKEGMKNENKHIVQYIEDNMINRKKLILSK